MATSMEAFSKKGLNSLIPNKDSQDAIGVLIASLILLKPSGWYKSISNHANLRSSSALVICK